MGRDRGDREGWPVPPGAGPSGLALDASPVALREVVVLCDRSGRLLSAHRAPAPEPPATAAEPLEGDEAAASPPKDERGGPPAVTWEALGVPPEVVRAVQRRCGAVAEAGRPEHDEVLAEAPGGGTFRVVDCWFTPVPGFPGEAVDRLVVIVRDITAERRAEDALRESERQYRLLAENASDMISRHEPDGTYLYVSPAGRMVTGYEPGELIGRSPYDFIHPDDLAEVRRAHVAMLASAEPMTVAFRGRWRDGSYVWLETTARAVRDEETGRVAEIQCSTRDITPRKQAEQELRENRELLQSVLDNCPSPVYIKDIHGRYLLVNRRFEGLFGVSRRVAIGKTDHQLFPAERAEALRSADRGVIVEGRAIEAEEQVIPFLPPDGDADGAECDPHTLLTLRFPLCERDGTAYAVCGIATDITARRRAEEALREKSVVLRSILDSMADAVVVADEREHFLEFNPAAQRMFGSGPTEARSPEWSRRYGLFLPDTVTAFPSDQLPLARALRGESTNDVEIFVRHAARPEGLWILVSGRPLTTADGRPAGGVVVCRDMTERKNVEERLHAQNTLLREAAEHERRAHDALKHAEVQLVQAEKLTALGQMVGGIAHEVNNPLAFVTNDMAVLQRDVAALRRVLDAYREADPAIEAHAPELLEKVRALAEEVDLGYTLENIDRLTTRARDGLKRIQQIVRDLRDFARPDEGDLKAVDLNVGVASTVNLIVGRARKLGVEVTTDLKPLPPVTCYPGKINQVILNLLANALDACAGPGGTSRPAGRVEVRTEPSEGQDAVLVRVIDNGPGIDPLVRERIFDPFFTTKPVGQGTGLGLSISYGIIKAHGGAIEVDSEPGHGATFTMRLPVHPPALEAAHSAMK